MKKEIEELEKIILQCVRIEPTQYSTIEYQDKFNGMGFRIDSKKFFSMLQKAGYRKADEVLKETAKEFKETMKYIFRFILRNKGKTSIPYFEAEERVFAKIDREVDREFLQHYGVEVDE